MPAVESPDHGAASSVIARPPAAVAIQRRPCKPMLPPDCFASLAMTEMASRATPVLAVHEGRGHAAKAIAYRSQELGARAGNDVQHVDDIPLFLVAASARNRIEQPVQAGVEIAALTAGHAPAAVRQVRAASGSSPILEQSSVRICRSCSGDSGWCSVATAYIKAATATLGSLAPPKPQSPTARGSSGIRSVMRYTMAAAAGEAIR